MTMHLRQSRITKAIIDRTASATFDAAEKQLAAINVAVVADTGQIHTAAGQAAALTALATSVRCFGRATLVADGTASLFKPLPVGATLGEAASRLGAQLKTAIPSTTTHSISLGADISDQNSVAIHCWWDGWQAGILSPWDLRPLGRSANPLAGIFAGALAVRQIFAMMRAGGRSPFQSQIASLWEPWRDPDAASPGPDIAFIPTRLWIIGLGHLGQGMLWSLGLLPAFGRHIVLQDDQSAGEENIATGLLTSAEGIGHRKTRIAARWLEPLGWQTSLLERRHYGDIPLLDHDPAIVLTSLDEPLARLKIASAGFAYMIDAGVGHGPVDFESLQIRILPRGIDPTPFWSKGPSRRDTDALMRHEAYQAHARHHGECGTFSLASASVAVPFVGAAVGALTMAQVIRLTCIMDTPQILQMDLGCPSLTMAGAFNSSPTSSLGNVEARVG